MTASATESATGTAPAPVPVHRVGTRNLLVDLPDLPTAMTWHAALTAAPLPGQTEVGAAARTVLVRFASATDAEAARGVLPHFVPSDTTATTPRDVTVEVHYDGADLETLAASLSMSQDALVDWHTSTTWAAAFGGFAPGFTYCVPADPAHALDVPRHDSPRAAVPDGAVALAGDFSAVYPRTSPGGWQLLGTTTRSFWDADAEHPALLSPGDRVHYQQVSERIEVGTPNAEVSSDDAAGSASSGASDTTRHAAPQPAHHPVLRLDDHGLQVLIEDAGRPGAGDLGVTTSGAADRASAQAANDALGNRRSAAVLENIGGLALTALVETVVVVTGAVAPVDINGRTAERGVPLLLRPGATLTVGEAEHGLRSYVGVRGGVIADTVLGSSSTDLLSGLGPSPLASGDTIHAGEPTGSVRPVSPGIRTDGVLRVVPGPRDDWFADGVDALTGRTWTVTAMSNRVGLRLTGEEAIIREQSGELASEGMVAGSVQVPPNGEPVVFLRDHAVTGGYPVIATVIPEDLDAAAQLPPGADVTFTIHNGDATSAASTGDATSTDTQEAP